MSFTFQGYQLTAGMHEDRFTQEATLLWGREKNAEYWQTILDKDTQDAGNTSGVTQLRTGLALGAISATGQFTHWNPYATDGSNYLIGFLLDEIDLSWVGGTTKERVHAVVLAGNIKADQVVIGGEADRGIAGTDYEFLLREQCAGRFLLDDDLGKSQSIKEYTLGAAVTALTVTTAMNKTHFVTDTALAADCTLTLPAPVPGLEFFITHPSTTAATELILDGPSTGEFWIAGAAANTLTFPGDNTTGFRRVRACRITDTTTDVYAYVVDNPVA